MCTDIDSSPIKNNIKKAFQIVKNLTRQKQPRVSTFRTKMENASQKQGDTEERWTEYCKELYNHQSTGDQDVLQVSNSTNDDDSFSKTCSQ